MLLNAGCRLTFTVQHPTPLVLLLAARSGQTVRHEQLVAHPAVPMTEHADLYGNRCHRLTAPPGTFSLAHYITTQSADNLSVASGAPFCLIDQLPDDALPFLLPSRYCPSDHKDLVWLANSIVTGQQPGYDQAEAIRHWIRINVRYEYGRSSSRTSALDTVRDRVGVCRDFTHLGIALCRALNLPARMVAGYLYDLKPMDLHAWFEVYVGNAWYAFDATQVLPRGNRIPLAIGRDAVDVAFLTQFGPTTLDLMEVWVKSATNESSPDARHASGDDSFVH